MWLALVKRSDYRAVSTEESGHTAALTAKMPESDVQVPLALKELSDFKRATLLMGVWKSADRMFGEQCVARAGTLLMSVLPVDSWGCRVQLQLLNCLLLPILLP